MTTLQFVLAGCVLTITQNSVFAQEFTASDNPEVEICDRGRSEQDRETNDTGFYAILSPQVGGGRFVYNGAEMKYISEKPVVKNQDIASLAVTTKRDHEVVKFKLKPDARRWFLTQSQLPIPGMYSVVLLVDGKIRSTQSLRKFGKRHSVKTPRLAKRESQRLVQDLRPKE